MKQKYIHKLSFYNTYHHLSFPKSGRTWIQYMLSTICSDQGGKDVNTILESNAPTFKNARAFHKRIKVNFSHGEKNYDLCRGVVTDSLYRDKKVLLLFRNPLDVLVSYYYHEKYRTKNFAGTITDFVHHDEKCLVENEKYKVRWGVKSLVNYYNALYSIKDDFDKCEIFFYEKFKQSPEENLQRMLDFCGIAHTEDQVLRAVNQGQFKNMKKLEQRGELSYYGLQGVDDKRGAKVRKAKVNSYKEDMSKSDIDFCKKYLAENLNDFFQSYKV